MTERTEQAVARCEGCNKAYRVPDPGRTYACKACGGVVRVAEKPEARQGHLVGAVTCDQCKAVNHQGAHFCDECGAVLESSAPVHRGEEALRERHAATAELKRGYGWIAAVTYLFRMGAVAYAAVTLIAIVALRSPTVPKGAGILVVALACLLTVLMLMGALQILFAPFRWTLALAALASVVSLVHLIGPDPLGLTFFWAAGWAVLFWIALVPTLQFHRLITRHEDLYILHHASRSTKRSLEGRSARDRHERLLSAKSRAARRALEVSAVIGGVIALVTALGAFIVVGNIRPQEFSLALEEFESAWDDADLAAVGQLFLPKIRERESERLVRIAEGHGWRDTLPKLAEGLPRADDESTIDYHSDDASVAAVWTLHDRSWFLIQLELPIPPLEQAVELFRRAWKSSSPGALAAFFPAEYQERMKESIESSIRRRKWSPFPEILETETTAPDEGEAAVVFEVEGGEVSTSWRFRSTGRWGLHSIKFPKP